VSDERVHENLLWVKRQAVGKSEDIEEVDRGQRNQAGREATSSERRMSGLETCGHRFVTFRRSRIQCSPADARWARRAEIHGPKASAREGQEHHTQEQWRPYDRPPEPQKDGVLPHPTIL
jgi:hypothetical protein